jgi:hypothetical protein
MSAADHVRFLRRSTVGIVRPDNTVPPHRYVIEEGGKVIARGRLVEKTLPRMAGQIVRVSPAHFEPRVNARSPEDGLRSN